MIDLTTPKGRLLAAALELASERAWRDIGLLDIAQAADMTLADCRQNFASKSEMLEYFTQCVDGAVVCAPPAQEEGESARDRLFEVIMNRFDLMAPYKPALKSIVASGALSPRQLQSLFNAQYWMLQTAGIATDGLRGQVRIAGLLPIYGAVFRKWLDDEDAGLARTMAALDRRLRRGESTLQRIDDACAGVSSALKGLVTALRGGKSKQEDEPAKSDPAAANDDVIVEVSNNNGDAPPGTIGA